MSCIWGGIGYTPSGHCTSGPWPWKPNSWLLQEAVCTSYSDTQCKIPINGGISYHSDQDSCVNAPGGQTVINSLSCSPNTPSCQTCIKCHTDCWATVTEGVDE